jgi:hypothetical protein
MVLLVEFFERRSACVGVEWNDALQDAPLILGHDDTALRRARGDAVRARGCWMRRVAR